MLEVAGSPFIMSHLSNFNQPSAEIKQAADFILSGGIGAIPTETVYGLAANALNPDAVRKIFTAKGRPFIDPLICHVSDIKMAETLADLSDRARELADKFWAGPLTMVLPRKSCVPDIVTAGLDTVAIRMPAHPIAMELIRICNCPLSAPSANPFGYVSPTRAEHVREQLGDKIDFILDGGECFRGVESTIVSVPNNPAEQVKILRFGPISPDDISEVLKESVDSAPKHNPAQPEAPGMLKTHYSPKSRLWIFDNPEDVAEKSENIIYFKRPENPRANEYWLSEGGDLEESARNLFALLRNLDKISPAGFFCQRVPDIAIGKAVNDRLSRAGTRML